MAISFLNSTVPKKQSLPTAINSCGPRTVPSRFLAWRVRHRRIPATFAGDEDHADELIVVENLFEELKAKVGN